MINNKMYTNIISSFITVWDSLSAFSYTTHLQKIFEYDFKLEKLVFSFAARPDFDFSGAGSLRFF